MHDNVPSYIRDTIYSLYCGQTFHNELHPELAFIDPLVRVQDAPPTLRMFRRLNAMFPHTEITKFEPTKLNQDRVTFDFEVIYKRKPSHRGQRMSSILTVAGNGSHVTSIQEDWKAPFDISSNALTALHPIRRLLGRLCGL